MAYGENIPELFLVKKDDFCSKFYFWVLLNQLDEVESQADVLVGSLRTR